MQHPMMFWACLIASSVILPQSTSLFLLAILVILCGCVTVNCYRNAMAGKRLLWVLGIGCLLMLWTQFWLAEQLSHRWPVERDGEDVDLLLEIDNVRDSGNYRSLQVTVLQAPDDLGVDIRRLKLGWYGRKGAFSHRLPVVGERLQGVVRLRALRGMVNGLPFDYEGQMLRKQVDARGYIRSVSSLAPVAANGGWRQRWLEQQQVQQGANVWPWIAGLVLGQQDAFTAEQWRVAQATGTLHLLVVSGLHLGMVCALLYGLLALVIRLLALAGMAVFVLRWQESRLIRALLMLILSGFYLWLAGAGVALQRAWLMLVVLLLVYGSGWRISPLLGWTVALLVMLVINPLMVLSSGFHYSMLAVLLLLLFLSGRNMSWLEGVWRPQWLIFVGLMPVALSWLQPLSPVHLLANAVAIPVLGFVMLPLVLLNVIWPGGWFAEPLVWFGDVWWQSLEWAARVPLPILSGAGIGLTVIWIGLLVLLYLGASPWRAALGTIASVVVLFMVPPAVPERLLLLDVGQGLSLLASANGHSLLYDTGARYSDELSVADLVIIPVLRQGAGVLDVVVSHSDQDHSGGVPSLLKRGAAVRDWYVGQHIESLNSALDCHQQDDRWHVFGNDGRWRFLLVPLMATADDNDHSCVVMLEWFGQRILIMGDLSSAYEQLLVGRYGDELRTDVLVASHHGSRSGSSRPFLETAKPREVWFSAGFHNHFGHPHEDVLERLRQLHISWRNTAEVGAIEMKPDGSVLGMRTGWQPVWRQL